MPIGTVHVPVFDPTAVIPGDEVSIGSGGHLEPTVPIVHVDVGGGTIEIDSSYNGGGGTKQPHYGGPLGQPDSGGYPDAPVHVVSAGGGMPDDLLYGVAYGNPIPQRDNYMNYEKITTGMFCVLVMSTDGAVQFVRVPFRVYL
jgi:hypothetical protein